MSAERPNGRSGSSSSSSSSSSSNELDTSDSYVNTLDVAYFDLISRAIQGDTRPFELIEQFKGKAFTVMCFLAFF